MRAERGIKGLTAARYHYLNGREYQKSDSVFLILRLSFLLLSCYFLLLYSPIKNKRKTLTVDGSWLS